MATRDGFYLGDVPAGFNSPLEHHLLSGAFLRSAGQFVSTYFLRRADVQQKLQFASTEALQITFPPFFNTMTGDLYMGTDTVLLTIKRPNGTLLPSPPAPTFDSDVHLWIAEVAVGSFAAGRWMIRAVSNGGSSIDQNINLTWGDYVDTIGTINTKVGTPAGASVSVDIAAVKTDTGTINTKVGTPAGASVSADIASVKTDTTKIGNPAGASVSADIAAVKSDTGTTVTRIGVPTGASIAADIAAIDLDIGAIDADLTTINNNVLTVGGLVAALPTAAQIRDAILNELLSAHSIVGSVADGIAVATGLLQGNFYMDQVDNSDPNGQTAARLRVWRSAAAMAGVTSGGTGEGEFAIFQVTTTYSGPSKIATHKVARTV